MAKKYKRSASASASTRPEPALSVPVEKVAAGFVRRAGAGTGEFNPDYGYVIKDLKRIGTLAGSFFVILIILSFFLNR
jgi:hypothetical protein